VGRAIVAEGLTKRYGSVVGVEDVDLEVPTGEVFGFIGPNGAGKTTTIRMLIDLLRPTRGRVRVLGLDPQHDAVEVHRRVGYLPGELSLHQGFAAGELLGWYANLRGGGADRIASYAERLGLDLSREVRELSSGNRQKVGLVQAFMSEPDLLVLDEPTRGLDPLVQQEFHRMVREVRAAGRTVFLSSHVLDEVEAVADRVGIVRAGQLVAVERVAALKERIAIRFEVRFGEDVPPGRFAGLAGVGEAEVSGRLGRFLVHGSPDALVKAVAEYEVTSLVSREPDLEEIFLAYYGEDGEEGG
jgi:ABC-2 type transport system ATP-binding protein